MDKDYAMLEKGLFIVSLCWFPGVQFHFHKTLLQLQSTFLSFYAMLFTLKILMPFTLNFIETTMNSTKLLTVSTGSRSCTLLHLILLFLFCSVTKNSQSIINTMHNDKKYHKELWTDRNSTKTRDLFSTFVTTSDTVTVCSLRLPYINTPVMSDPATPSRPAVTPVHTCFPLPH